YGLVLIACMYASPIIYPMNALPSKLQFLMHFNPMYYFVTFFRDLLLYGSIPPNPLFHLACVVSAGGMLAIGLLVFKKLQTKFILHI
ncbi:MAG: ABC transporter permease, partial [Oscillospiraceae bacterium]|nr:ABC transporter permease [Oscillospiraceae bacterium]